MMENSANEEAQIRRIKKKPLPCKEHLADVVHPAPGIREEPLPCKLETLPRCTAARIKEEAPVQNPSNNKEEALLCKEHLADSIPGIKAEPLTCKLETVPRCTTAHIKEEARSPDYEQSPCNKRIADDVHSLPGIKEELLLCEEHLVDSICYNAFAPLKKEHVHYEPGNLTGSSADHIQEESPSYNKEETLLCKEHLADVIHSNPGIKAELLTCKLETAPRCTTAHIKEEARSPDYKQSPSNNKEAPLLCNKHIADDVHSLPGIKEELLLCEEHLVDSIGYNASASLKKEHVHYEPGTITGSSADHIQEESPSYNKEEPFPFTEHMLDPGIKEEPLTCFHSAYIKEEALPNQNPSNNKEAPLPCKEHIAEVIHLVPSIEEEPLPCKLETLPCCTAAHIKEEANLPEQSPSNNKEEVLMCHEHEADVFLSVPNIKEELLSCELETLTAAHTQPTSPQKEEEPFSWEGTHLPAPGQCPSTDNREEIKQCFHEENLSTPNDQTHIREEPYSCHKEHLDTRWFSTCSYLKEEGDSGKPCSSSPLWWDDSGFRDRAQQQMVRNRLVPHTSIGVMGDCTAVFARKEFISEDILLSKTQVPCSNNKKREPHEEAIFPDYGLSPTDIKENPLLERSPRQTGISNSNDQTRIEGKPRSCDTERLSNAETSIYIKDCDSGVLDATDEAEPSSPLWWDGNGCRDDGCYLSAPIQSCGEEGPAYSKEQFILGRDEYLADTTMSKAQMPCSDHQERSPGKEEKDGTPPVLNKEGDSESLTDVDSFIHPDESRSSSPLWWDENGFRDCSKIREEAQLDESDLTMLAVPRKPVVKRKTFSCQFCGKSYLRQEQCEAHQKTHQREKPYECKHCDKSFNIRTSLLRHQSVHTGINPYPCTQCNKAFKTRGGLLHHQHSHTGKKPQYKCKECGKIFSTRSGYAYHRCASHTVEKPYACKECGKQFANNFMCLQHQQVHAEEKPYSCPDCGRSFSQKSNLRVHQRCHTGEKPFTCSECGKSFTAKGTLNQHLRIHTGETPYCCPKCGKSFKQHWSLTQHEKRGPCQK